jgi:hypothetical protein
VSSFYYSVVGVVGKLGCHGCPCDCRRPCRKIRWRYSPASPYQILVYKDLLWQKFYTYILYEIYTDIRVLETGSRRVQGRVRVRWRNRTEVAVVAGVAFALTTGNFLFRQRRQFCPDAPSVYIIHAGIRSRVFPCKNHPRV